MPLAPPSFGEALAARVRLAGMDLPFWVALLPVLGVVVALSVLLAGMSTGASGEKSATASAGTAAPEGASAAPAVSETSAVKEPEVAPATHGGTLVEQARSGDEKALAALTQKKPRDLGSEEALALAAGRMAQEQNVASKLRARLAADPGLAKDPKVIADLRRLAQEADTSRDALAAMAALPGPLSADLLYEVWTSTAERSQTTELAQALTLSRDVRPKASPALAVALDLREAETCEANAKILPRAVEVGDKRALAPLSRLLRRTGCGPAKRDDCYTCLREGELLKQAFTAVKLRREPDFVRRDGP
ncbi:MAG TPA: hypothetical protein VGQ57_18240 [Polyangiaceae bacterium]|nr:hypothetical protein [Polyangiaceae bacterium]